MIKLLPLDSRPTGFVSDKYPSRVITFLVTQTSPSCFSTASLLHAILMLCPTPDHPTTLTKMTDHLAPRHCHARLRYTVESKQLVRRESYSPSIRPPSSSFHHQRIHPFICFTAFPNPPLGVLTPLFHQSHFSPLPFIFRSSVPCPLVPGLPIPRYPSPTALCCARSIS